MWLWKRKKVFHRCSTSKKWKKVANSFLLSSRQQDSRSQRATYNRKISAQFKEATLSYRAIMLSIKAISTIIMVVVTLYMISKSTKAMSRTWLHHTSLALQKHRRSLKLSRFSGKKKCVSALTLLTISKLLIKRWSNRRIIVSKISLWLLLSGINERLSGEQS